MKMQIIIFFFSQPVIRVAHVPGTDFYDDVDKFSTVFQFSCHFRVAIFDVQNVIFQVEEIPGIKVVYFQAPLHYANVERFKLNIFKACAIIKKEKDLPSKRKVAISLPPNAEAINVIMPTRHLILNCSGIVYVDIMGVNALKQVRFSM